MVVFRTKATCKVFLIGITTLFLGSDVTGQELTEVNHKREIHKKWHKIFSSAVLLTQQLTTH